MELVEAIELVATEIRQAVRNAPPEQYRMEYQALDAVQFAFHRLAQLIREHDPGCLGSHYGDCAVSGYVDPP